MIAKAVEYSLAEGSSRNHRALFMMIRHFSRIGKVGTNFPSSDISFRFQLRLKGLIRKRSSGRKNKFVSLLTRI